MPSPKGKPEGQQNQSSLPDRQSYRPPEIGQGWPVLWRLAKNDPPSTGFVTEVAERTLSLIVFPPGAIRGIVKTAVRHIDDPSFRSSEVGHNEDGCWDHTTFGSRMLRLTAELSTIPE